MDDFVIQRVDHLLIIGHALRRFGLRELIDARCPRDPRSLVSTGECIEAIVAAILLGGHTLYRVHDRLAQYDLRVAFGWEGLAEQFHDNRIGKALDQTFQAGVSPLYAAAILRAVKVHELDLTRLHLDTTSVRLFGEYEGSVAPEDPESLQAIPKVERGYSKDHRPDLKQVIFGISVAADGATPMFGRFASGSRNDSLESRFILEQLARVLPEPRGTLLVGDSKLFSGESLLAARTHGFEILTLMPRSVGLWDEALAAYDEQLSRGEAPPTLKAVYSELGGSDPASLKPEKLWTGASFTLTYTWEDDERQKHDFPLRLLVVESSQLREQKTPAVRAECDKARGKLEKAVAKLTKEEFNCAADAQSAAIKLVENHGSAFHVAHHRVVQGTRVAKRAGPGRPPANEPPIMETIYQVEVKIEEDPHVVERVLRRRSCFVLASTLSRKAKPDVELFRDYQEQNKVEGAISWMKHPLRVAPVFLKTEERMSALGLVYVLSLMIYALIQRDVRQLLAKHQDEIPGNRGQTDRPTTEVIFRLFQGIDTVRSPENAKVTIKNLNTSQLDVLRLLGHELLDNPLVHVARPEPARRGTRGYKPPKQPKSNDKQDLDNSATA